MSTHYAKILRSLSRAATCASSSRFSHVFTIIERGVRTPAKPDSGHGRSGQCENESPCRELVPSVFSIIAGTCQACRRARLVSYMPLESTTRTRRTTLPKPRKQRVSANKTKTHGFDSAAIASRPGPRGYRSYPDENTGRIEVSLVPFRPLTFRQNYTG